ncbi:unnamed protein product [Moneuplotes crassus]|uniref:Uncharacterized protein n=1 Tax=Euplotes crassus TaxID=5936 RepID=A0AAD1U4Z3_EUPCR|nr:unnamed protein product [Moneuplotes crassus]
MLRTPSSDSHSKITIQNRNSKIDEPMSFRSYQRYTDISRRSEPYACNKSSFTKDSKRVYKGYTPRYCKVKRSKASHHEKPKVFNSFVQKVPKFEQNSSCEEVQRTNTEVKVKKHVPRIILPTKSIQSVKDSSKSIIQNSSCSDESNKFYSGDRMLKGSVLSHKSSYISKKTASPDKTKKPGYRSVNAVRVLTNKSKSNPRAFTYIKDSSTSRDGLTSKENNNFEKIETENSCISKTIEEEDKSHDLKHGGYGDQDDIVISSYASNEQADLYQINEDSVEHFPTDSLENSYKEYLEKSCTQKTILDCDSQDHANYQSEGSELHMNDIHNLSHKKPSGYFG